jgi:hypothetical protein
LGRESWLAKDLAAALHLSPAEVSNSLSRSVLAGLLDGTKRKVVRASLLDFLRHGLPHVYPVRPGGLVRGVPTAHSAPALRDRFLSDETYVWPSAKGNAQGQAIAPLYPGVPEAALEDDRLYAMLALSDALRVGRARERAEAVKELAKLFKA